MKSALLPALALGLAACAPALRPATMATPHADAGHARGDAGADAGALDGRNGNDWAEGAIAIPNAAAARLTAEDVRSAFDGAAFSASTWDIEVLPYAGHDRVAHYVELFSGPARERVLERLRRGTRYEAMIRAKLRAGGLPEDLYYLAFVESGFEPHAYSRAAAVGLWQFMTTTARLAGLRVDWWVDERRDPVRATDAAVRHLRSLRNEFGGSLYLAAAAYNGGSGRISRGLAQHAGAVGDAAGNDRFFALAATGYLREETREYVPQLIAAALVAKSPASFGLVVEPLPPFVYDTVRVPGGTPLAAVAAASGATVPEIQDLNGHLLRGATPPGESMAVRVPLGRAAGFAERLGELPAERRVGFDRVTTEENGRLSAIAARHDLSERQLATFNPSLRRNKRGLLVGGQTVIVPTPAVVAAALDVPDPAVERYGTSPGTPAPTTTGSARTAAKESAARGSAKPAAPASPRTHTVAAGEALGPIARRYDLSVAELRRLNGLASDLIRVGQVLTVAPAAAPATPAGKGTVRASRAASAARARASGGGTPGAAKKAPAKRPAAAKAPAKTPAKTPKAASRAR